MRCSDPGLAPFLAGGARPASAHLENVILHDLLADIQHLRAFHAEYGRQARAGLLLNTGTAMEWLAPDVLAVPWWRVV